MPGYPAPPVTENHVEPAPRRIRACVDAGADGSGAHQVFDTTRALYVWEWPPYPQYVIPRVDVDEDCLVGEGPGESTSRGPAESFALRVGRELRHGAAIAYTNSPIPGLTGMLRFRWDALDHWYEEDEEIFVHPRNPYARVDALRSNRRIRVERDGVVLAEAPSGVLVFETGLPTRYYLERTSVRFEHLIPSATRTSCPYKGNTSGYWSARAASEMAEDAKDIAWAYDFPTRQLQPVAGLVAFYNDKVDIYVDGDKVDRREA